MFYIYLNVNKYRKNELMHHSVLADFPALSVALTPKRNYFFFRVFKNSSKYIIYLFIFLSKTAWHYTLRQM